MMFLMPGIGLRFFCTACEAISERTLTVASLTPSSFSMASFAAAARSSSTLFEG